MRSSSFLLPTATATHPLLPPYCDDDLPPSSSLLLRGVWFEKKQKERFLELVQKFFARLCFNDFLSNASFVARAAKEQLAPLAYLSGDESYSNRNLEKASQQVSKKYYDAKVRPTTLLPKQVGNMYTASLYAAFASLIHNKHDTPLTCPTYHVKGCSGKICRNFATNGATIWMHFVASKDTTTCENGSVANGH